MSEKIIVAIDGPAASGKSTAAKLLAEQLGYLYLDTGAMYRAITYYILENKAFDNTERIIELTKNITLDMNYSEGVTHVFVNGKEVTDFIRLPEISEKVSEISKIPEVRKEMVKLQRSLAEKGSLVAEGRDITTVVFPEADVKVFMTATLEERAKRRYLEHRAKGDKVTLEEVKQNLIKRDKIDSTRKVSPLKKADDAFELDTTNLTIDEEIEKILNLVNLAKQSDSHPN